METLENSGLTKQQKKYSKITLKRMWCDDKNRVGAG